MVEHYLDTVGVRGSKPLPRTIFRVITSKAVCSIVISALSLTAVFQEPSAQNSAIARGVKKRITIYAPRPKYERCWPEGAGIFLLHVEQTGIVTGTDIFRSTESKILDDSAVETLKRWRFQAGTAQQIKIPITFVSGYKARIIEQKAQQLQNTRGPMPASSQ